MNTIFFRRAAWVVLVVAGAAGGLAYASLRPSPQETPGACHARMHAVGDRAYAAHRERPEEGLAQVPQDAAACGWGYYHAYFEDFFEDHPEPTNVSPVCDRAGAGRSDAPAIRRVCYGSAGSGFVRAALATGAAPSLTKAPGPELQQCSVLADATDSSVCQGGVFGELIYRASLASSTSVSGSRLWQLCAPLEGAARVACYGKAGAALFLAGNYSFRTLAVFAATLPGEKEKRAAFTEGVGVFVIDPSYGLAPEKVLSECLRYTPKAAWCAEGVARGVFDAAVGAPPEREAMSFCSSDTLKARGLDVSCYGEVGALVAEAYTPARADVACRGVPREFRYLCAPRNSISSLISSSTEIGGFAEE